MELTELLQRIDPAAARAFVTAARNVVDALLIEGERVRQTETPAARDYNTAELSRAAPAGGWLGHAELREAVRRLGEAVAAEKWTDGFLAAVKVLGLLGVLP